MSICSSSSLWQWQIWKLGNGVAPTARTTCQRRQKDGKWGEVSPSQLPSGSRLLQALLAASEAVLQLQTHLGRFSIRLPGNIRSIWDHGSLFYTICCVRHEKNIRHLPNKPIIPLVNLMPCNSQLKSMAKVTRNSAIADKLHDTFRRQSRGHQSWHHSTCWVWFPISVL